PAGTRGRPRSTSTNSSSQPRERGQTPSRALTNFLKFTRSSCIAPGWSDVAAGGAKSAKSAVTGSRGFVTVYGRCPLTGNPGRGGPLTGPGGCATMTDEVADSQPAEEPRRRREQSPDVGILITIRSLLPNLAPVEQRVAQAVLDDPGGVAWRSISELAQS